MADPAGGTRGGKRGFSLVEILVAFAILALTVGAVMSAMSGGLRILSVTEAHGAATRIAESRLSEAGLAAPLRPGSREGEEGRYRWRVTVSPYDTAQPVVDEAVPPAYLVVATVGWRGGRSVTLSTIKFGRAEDD